MHVNSNEYDLASGIKASDQTALKAFYSKHYLSVLQFLHYRCQHREFAEDLAQDAFCKLWENRDKIDPSRSLKSYLYQIANHLFIDAVRRKKIERRVSEIKPEISSPDMETNLTVRMAIQRLPDQLKTVFVMSRLEGFRMKELAEILGISAKTAEHRIYKALKLLKKELADSFTAGDRI
jgi:RNA polymerase sigma-70 factor (ECF subfamily)